MTAPPKAAPKAAQKALKPPNVPKFTARPSKPSPEEIEAKRQARAAKRAAEAEAAAAGAARVRAAALGDLPDDGGEFLSRDATTGDRLYLPRSWTPVAPSAATTGRPMRILSWNMLAQGLVRRSLFPGSDALRMADREAGLEAELVGHRWDLGCFQEVDRTDIHCATLDQSGYSYVYEKGYPAKQHGLMIAWRIHPRSLSGQGEGVGHGPVFERKPAAQKTIFLDHVDVAQYLPNTTSRTTRHARRACSRITRNIALFVALPLVGGGGVIAATTHLFWHPMHGYERARQVGIIARELDTFRKSEPAFSDWPTIFAGDFNDQPDSAAYALLTGQEPGPNGVEEVARSTVVHQSVDQLGEREKADQVHRTGEEDGDEGEDEAGEEDGSGEGGSDDRMLKNCRHATAADGLLTLTELAELHRIPDGNGHALSTYGTYNSDPTNMFGTPGPRKERWNDETWTPDTPNPHEGPCKEPMFTLFSPLFSLTLDYIFLFPQGNLHPKVSALLPTHPKDVLQVGLPRKGICCSDHIPIGAQIQI